MVGIELSAIDTAFRKVPAHQTHRPIRSFDAMDRIGERARAYLAARFDDGFDLRAISHNVPLKAYHALTHEEIAKINYSTYMMMDETVRDLFKTDTSLRVVDKLRNSAWQWGFRRLGWNETVDAYEGLRSFDLGVPGFSVTLDMTTGCNEKGWSEHSRTYLDGVFGYLVHWKGEHVMTIGLSVSSHHRILLQQVQTKNRTGNRWLFRLPANRMEHIIDRLKAAFPRHTIHVVDGAAVAQANIDSYRDGANSLSRRIGELEERIRRGPRDPKGTAEEMAELQGRRDELERKAASLEADIPRLAAAYGDTGRHRLTEEITTRGMLHRLAA